jgi:hypothetical protein
VSLLVIVYVKPPLLTPERGVENANDVQHHTGKDAADVPNNREEHPQETGQHFGLIPTPLLFSQRALW